MTLLMLVDGSNIFWRAYFGNKARLESESGEETWAVHSTINTVASLAREHEPTHALVAFDLGRSAFRAGLWPGYKGGGAVDPEKAMAGGQREESIKLLRMLGLTTVREEGVEADDIIAAAVRKFSRGQGVPTLIVSGDGDLLQLVGDHVRVLQPALGGKRTKAEKMWDADAVAEAMGVWPWLLPDIWALTGQVGDGVPGVPGIGPKKALALIQAHGSASRAAVQDKRLEGHADVIRLSHRLVELTGLLASMSMELDDLKISPTHPGSPEGRALLAELDRLEMVQIRRRWLDGTMWRETVRRRRLRESNAPS